MAEQDVLDTADDKPHYLGHRQRLRERFLEKGADSLTDYELLELLLCVAIPRRDLKPLAKKLISRFGTLGAVLSAPKERLLEINGVGETVLVALKVSQAASIALQREEILNQPVISSWTALIGYCRSVMAHETEEQFRVLFLDKKNTLMLDEVQSSGTVDQTPIYPREVIKRALELGATALIMVHNHPSGDPTPSRDDIEMTRELTGTAQKLGITVHDHLIIARRGHVSFKTMGLL